MEPLSVEEAKARLLAIGNEPPGPRRPGERPWFIEHKGVLIGAFVAGLGLSMLTRRSVAKSVFGILGLAVTIVSRVPGAREAAASYIAAKGPKLGRRINEMRGHRQQSGARAPYAPGAQPPRPPGVAPLPAHHPPPPPIQPGTGVNVAPSSTS